MLKRLAVMLILLTPVAYAGANDALESVKSGLGAIQAGCSVDIVKNMLPDVCEFASNINKYTDAALNDLIGYNKGAVEEFFFNITGNENVAKIFGVGKDTANTYKQLQDVIKNYKPADLMTIQDVLDKFDQAKNATMGDIIAQLDNSTSALASTHKPLENAIKSLISNCEDAAASNIKNAATAGTKNAKNAGSANTQSDQNADQDRTTACRQKVLNEFKAAVDDALRQAQDANEKAVAAAQRLQEIEKERTLTAVRASAEKTSALGKEVGNIVDNTAKNVSDLKTEAQNANSTRAAIQVLTKGIGELMSKNVTTLSLIQANLAELARQNVYTNEQLAAVSDQIIKSSAQQYQDAVQTADQEFQKAEDQIKFYESMHKNIVKTYDSLTPPDCMESSDWLKACSQQLSNAGGSK